MNKKFLSAILFGALMVTSTGTFVSCKDYEDDIQDVQEQVNANKSECTAGIQALQNQLTSLQGALSAAQSDADAKFKTAQASAEAAAKAAQAAQAAADAAQATGDAAGVAAAAADAKAQAAQASADAAAAAAAQAKADAIAKAIKEAEELKAWVVSQNYVTEEALAEALLPISAKIAAVETSLDEIWVYINEKLSADDQAAFKAIMTMQEELAIQQETLDNYKLFMDDLNAELTTTREELQEAITALNNLLEDANKNQEELWAELTWTKNELSAAITAVNNLIADETGKLWEELTLIKSELSAAITALNNLLEKETGELWAEIQLAKDELYGAITALGNIHADDKEALMNEINEILKANKITSETLAALIVTQADDKAELQNEIQQILLENAKLTESLSALYTIHGEDNDLLWAELTSSREELQEAITALSNLMGDEDAKLWNEINQLVQQNVTTSETLSTLYTMIQDLDAAHAADKKAIEDKIEAAKGELSKLISSELEALNVTIADMKDEMTAIWGEIASNHNEVNQTITSVYNQLLDLEANLGTLKTLVKTRLTALLFAPSTYVDGIEAIAFRTLKYNPLTIDEDYVVTTANDHITLSDGKTEASYYVSPSHIDLNEITAWNVLLNDAQNFNSSRAAVAPITATVKSLENGKLTLNLKKNHVEAFGGYGDEFKIMALQAELKAEEGETAALVTSDWARIFEAHYLPQIHATDYKAEVHLWDYATAKAAQEGELIIKQSDYKTPINLNELVTVCLSDTEKDVEEAEEIKLTAAQMEAYGLKFEFNLLDEYLLKTEQDVEETNQELFAKITEEGGIYTLNSLAIGSDKMNENADAVGREPLVQVILWDTENNEIVDVNYFKVKWTAVTDSKELGELESFKHDFACETAFADTVKTLKMNEFFYTELNMSKEQFHHIYKPENSPKGFILYDEEGNELAAAYAGKIKQIKAEGSTTTYNIVWNFTTSNVTPEEWAAKKVQRTVYMKYVNETNKAETITFSMSREFTIPEMGLGAGYVQTYWSYPEGTKLEVANTEKVFQVNPALTTDKYYGIANYTTCRLITNLLHGYNVAGIDADKLTISDIANEYTAETKFVFDGLRAAAMNEDWSVSEDGTILYVDGVEAAQISEVNDKAYIKLYETDNYNVATEAAKTLVGQMIPVQIVGTHCSGYTTVLDSYLVHFIEPLAASFNMKDGELKDLLTGGSFLDIRTAISVKEKFGLYRDVIYATEDGKLATNEELVGWYAVEPAVWDLAKATTNLSIEGNNLVITDKFETLFSEHEDKYQIEVEKSSKGNPKSLKFTNFSGTHIQQAFKVRIPVYVKTKWNSMLTDQPDYIEVTIVPGDYDK